MIRQLSPPFQKFIAMQYGRNPPKSVPPVISYTLTAICSWAETVPLVEKAIRLRSSRPKPLYTAGTMIASVSFERHMLGAAVVAPPSVAGYILDFGKGCQ